MHKIIIPPIKSQGIKTKLVPWIAALIPHKAGRWIEPFMGTGVVAFNVGFSKALLADSNPYVIDFYNAIQDKALTPVMVGTYLEREGDNLRNAGNLGSDHYNYIRDRFNEQGGPLDFLFLSRAGFNGMMRFNHKGKWNIPFCKKPDRFRKGYITKIVNQVIRVSLVINEDWIFAHNDFRDILPQAREQDIIYCDPPYHGRYAGYYGGWTDQDEHDLYEALRNTKARFILSTWHHNAYRENPMIHTYWNHFNMMTGEHFYHVGGKIDHRNSMIEALVYNF